VSVAYTGPWFALLTSSALCWPSKNEGEFVKGLSRLEEAPCRVLAVQLEQRSSGSVKLTRGIAAVSRAYAQTGRES
jgi:hypothetical protein